MLIVIYDETASATWDIPSVGNRLTGTGKELSLRCGGTRTRLFFRDLLLGYLLTVHDRAGQGLPEMSYTAVAIALLVDGPDWLTRNMLRVA